MVTYKEQQNQKYTDRTLQMLCDLPDFCSIFYDKKQQKLSPKTLCDYTRHMKDYLEYLQQYDPRFSDRELINFTVEDLSQISVSDATDFIKWITRSIMDDRASGAGNKMSLSSAKTWKACISAYFMFFTFSGQLNGNPFTCVNLAKIITYDDVREKETEETMANKKAMAAVATDVAGSESVINNSFTTVREGNGSVAGKQSELSDEESIRFRQQFMLKHGIRDTLICSILQDTGICISELVELNEKDVDLDNQRFYVYRVKNKSPWVSISDDVCGLLQVYTDQRTNWIRLELCESGFCNHDNLLDDNDNLGNTSDKTVDGADNTIADNVNNTFMDGESNKGDNSLGDVGNPSEPSEEGWDGSSEGNDTIWAAGRLGLLESQLFTKQIPGTEVIRQGDLQRNEYLPDKKPNFSDLSGLSVAKEGNVDLDALFIVMAGRCRGQRLSVRTVQRAMKEWKREMREYQSQKGR